MCTRKNRSTVVENILLIVKKPTMAHSYSAAIVIFKTKTKRELFIVSLP